MVSFLLAIDQGTTNSKAIIINDKGKLVSQYEIGVRQHYPNQGWVEQQPEDLFNNTVECCRLALKAANLTPRDIAAIGISNQRETTIIWDKHTGKPIYPAIVWQDRRTSDVCKKLAKCDRTNILQKKTGLIIDPYFSATKIMWILDNVPNARDRAERGDLLFGTVDCYLIWMLTLGKSHVTDVTNASRTLLFNIHTLNWDKDILKTLNIPAQILPTVLDNTAHFGDIDVSIFGRSIPITGVAGDQQAAAIGQACLKPGMVKTTYGTGSFMLLNTGTKPVASHHQLLTTILYRINKKTIYSMEGSIFSAGVTIKWLRDNLQLIDSAPDTEAMAKGVINNAGVYLVPAFTGLGAPYWAPEARAAILGLSMETTTNHIVRAALESVAYQTRDLLNAMHTDYPKPITLMHVDGGMSVNDWLLQFISDILDIPVQRPVITETTALGAAYLAGLQIGLFSSLDEIANLWEMNAEFKPKMLAPERNSLYDGWKRAIKRIIK